jgi:hypothetical protein
MFIVTYHVSTDSCGHNRVCYVEESRAKNTEEAVKYVMTHYTEVTVLQVRESYVSQHSVGL